ncbi:DNA-binding transcriptional LysR family regulator [Halanaerobium saccharolyticum]|uniref:DNA-binding transcriptional LysR family regulator n=1 Tax=Halanaerobium saccharolyticum TaxID=43595 RepID=A0A4R7YY24_9FIRM|nr:LysR family transcriptional regulator [Halanaerobium saccharolyticum]RAK06504.1 DNA-binding transcriptional LysR family regulator [Halanaerobium saccharolyticum]TDW01048.1 DNA-binding transcriptional LysR family regulator [Halanaerobium saccharolyticum]TDX52629.1 DNA-binding transcriptional LysR family regulator [Halanaerobium saccharolyticum]
MIDFRHQTFLQLCRIKNYTKTASKLHITQPTVTQHIQHLEKHYGVKLFNYSGKSLEITEAGKKLYKYTERMTADSKEIEKTIKKKSNTQTIKFGATLTIGEFVMPNVLNQVMKKNPELNFDMLVENTETLLNKLKAGEINFALLEGFFDKSKFDYQLFSNEKFIGICSPLSKYSQQKIRLEDLLDSRLILRENGSGTREILEQILYTNNLSQKSFANKLEIGNLNAIKELVAKNRGISFIYQAAAKKELANNLISDLKIIDFNIKREFNFVYLKNSIFEDQYHKYFKLFSSYRK